MGTCTGTAASYTLQMPEWLVAEGAVEFDTVGTGNMNLLNDFLATNRREKKTQPGALFFYVLRMFEWLLFLRTVCAIAEGTAELGVDFRESAQADAAMACVLAVLGDSQCRLTVMGGREDMPRSLGSIYSGSVTRFLRGCRGKFSRAIATLGLQERCNGVAVSRDGSALLVSDESGPTHGVHVYGVHTGAFQRTIGSFGSAPLLFRYPSQVWVASDGFVFVADCENHRIQILTPRYDFYGLVGNSNRDSSRLRSPQGVCANDKVVVVSHWSPDFLSVFRRDDGRHIRSFGDRKEVEYPCGLCFVSGHCIAVADFRNSRVSVWTLEGEFVRHVGVGTLNHPTGVACSDADELIVADSFNGRVVVFSASGQILWTSELCAAGQFIGVAVHGRTIFGQTKDGKCVVFK